MRTIIPGCVFAVLIAVSGGCGGYYTVSLADHVSRADEQVPVVVRLQRNDFFILNLAMKNSPMRFRSGSGIERVAYTDKLGYAGTVLPVSEVPGRYPLRVDLSDHEGEEVSAQAGIYVWDPDKPVLAVDLSCLPESGTFDHASASAVLKKFAREGNIVYLTRSSTKDHASAHARMLSGGYPDGPVLLWRRQRWHITRGRWKLPKVVVESRLVSQIDELKKRFPGLRRGVCGSDLAADALLVAGVTPIVIGASSYQSWQSLESRGFEAAIRVSPDTPGQRVSPRP